MTIDWEQIKYVFQIPKKWFQDIGNKIDHMYGEGFVNVKENGRNDGIEIGIDHEQFESEVRRITGTTEHHVSTVDGIGPGSDGDVQLGAVRSINGEYFPDANGNVVIQVGDGRVKTVDGIGPFSDGNVLTNAIKSINHEYYPDSWGDGNVDIDLVKKVDGKLPDENGNINLGALTTLDIADQGSTAGPSYKGDKPVSPMSHNHNIDEVLGVKNEDGTYNFVKSINTQLKPDSNGNINLNLPDVPAGQFLVGSVDGIAPENEKGDVKLGAVRSIKIGDTAQDILKPDANGQIDLGEIDGSVKTVNWVEPDEDGNIDLGNIVYSVNDVLPDESGNVSLEIEAEDVSGLNTYTTNIVNTKIESHLSPITKKLENLTHNDITDWATATYSFLDVMDVADLGVIAGPNYEGEKYICPTNHNHNFDELLGWEDTLDEKYVTLDTTQTISGAKTFTQSIVVQESPSVVKGVEVKPEGVVAIFNEGNDGGLEFLNLSGTRVGGIMNQSSGLTFYNKINNINIACNPDVADSLLQLTAPQNRSVLFNSPSDDCTITNAIATVGWVRKNAGGVKSIDTNYTPDANGNIDLKAVRTEGDQTINGNKWFKSQIVVGPENDGMRAVYGQNRVELYHPTGTSYIDFHSFGDKADYDARIADYQNLLSITTLNKNIEIYAQNNGQVNIAAGKDKAILNVQPSATTSTTSKAIATVGWCNTYLGRVKSVNGNGPDANGNVVIETGNGTVKSVDGVSPNSQGNVNLGAVVTTKVETSGTVVSRTGSYERYVCPTAHGHTAGDINIGNSTVYNWMSGWATSYYSNYWEFLTDQGFVRNLEINGKPVNYGEDGVDRFEFGFASNKWVKTDGTGRLTTTDETPIALPAGTSGQNTTRTVLTGLSWNGTQLVATRENWTFTKGCLTGVSAASNITINTVAYS